MQLSFDLKKVSALVTTAIAFIRDTSEALPLTTAGSSKLPQLNIFVDMHVLSVIPESYRLYP